MKVNLFLLLLIFISLTSFCYATCGASQIDINSASLTDLDKLTGIGPAKAQAIIDARPYKNVDELVNAYGIGSATLEKIKAQGLACVSSENIITVMAGEPELGEQTETPEEPTSSKSETLITSRVVNEEPAIENEPTESIINLNSDTKIEKKIIYESRTELVRKYSIYALAFFLLVVIVFLLFEKNGRKEDYSDDDY